MGHNPAFQFYPGDWFREPGLQRVDLDVRGAWAELLMMMHHETPRGVSTGSISGLARQLRITVPRACYIVEQLATNKIADVEYFDEGSQRFIEETADTYEQSKRDMSPECPELSPECPYFVTLKNRRMVKEESDREYERLKKQKQRRPAKVQPNVPEMSRPLLQSPSPSPKNLAVVGTPAKPKTNGKDHAIKELLTHYDSLYLAIHHARPVIDGQDAKAAQSILRNRTIELAKKMVSSYLRNPPDFYKDKGLYGMRHILSAANTLLARREVSG